MADHIFEIHTEQLFIKTLFSYHFSTFTERKEEATHTIQNSFLLSPSTPLAC